MGYSMWLGCLLPSVEVPWAQLIKRTGTVSAVIYRLPRSFCLESWAAALFMAVSCKSAPRAGFSSALEDEDVGKGGGGGGARCSDLGAALNRSLTPARLFLRSGL